MIRIVAEVNPVLAAPGQYVKRSISFVSSKPLTGKNLAVDIALYADNEYNFNTGDAYVFQYASGVSERKINYKLELEVLDKYRFILHYSFFVTKDWKGFMSNTSISYRDAFNIANDISSAIFFKLRAYDRLEEITGTYRLPVKITKSCNGSITFKTFVDDIETTGFFYDEDLKIVFESTESVNNNYYAIFYREDAIGSVKDIAESMGFNYALINSTINQVDDDVPIQVFKLPVAFKNYKDKSIASISIDKAFIRSSGTYRCVLVYQVGGTWYSCTSGPIDEALILQATNLDFTDQITDYFNNVGDAACAKNLLKNRQITVCTTPDKDDFTTQLTNMGIGGTFDSRLVTVNCYHSSSPSIGGIPLMPFEVSGMWCAMYTHSSDQQQQYVIFEFVFNMNGYRDRHFKVFDLEFVQEVTYEDPDLTQGGDAIKFICEENEDLITVENLSSDPLCTKKISINGAAYTESNILVGNQIDPTLIENGTEICILEECTAAPATTPPTLPDPEKCYQTKYTLTASNTCASEPFSITFETGGQIITKTSGGTDIVFESNQPISLVNFNTFPGCRINTFVSVSSVEIPCDTTIFLTTRNNAAINFTIDEDTQTVTLSKTTDFESTVDTEEYLVSLDGGITFINAPSTITEEEIIYVQYKVTFTDGSDPLQIEQVINNRKKIVCENSRTFELSVVDGKLEIDFTDSFESTVIEDDLFISFDDFDTHIYFDLKNDTYTPINLEGGEFVKVRTRTSFDKDCADFIIEDNIQVDDELENTECDGDYAPYTLVVEHDSETSLFTVELNGDRNALKIDDARWTVDNGNPFDINNTGVPYTGPIMGAGLLIVRWKIQLPGCPVKFLDAFAFGTRATKIEIPPVRIQLPNAPIQFCEVNCCVPDAYIECVDLVLTVYGDLTGISIAWTGPNGFSATGNNVTIPDTEGEYVASLTGAACSNTVSYFYDKPNAGVPTDTIIIVQ